MSHSPIDESNKALLSSDVQEILSSIDRSRVSIIDSKRMEQLGHYSEDKEDEKTSH